MNCPICSSNKTFVKYVLYDDRYGYPGQYDLLECKYCGHKFLDASFSEEQIKDLYTNYYPRSDWDIDSLATKVLYQPGFKSWLDGDARAFAFVPENVKILDIGCGFGETLLYHKKRNCEVHGIDADANLLRVAEKYKLNARVGTFDDRYYDPSYFDYVTMDQVLEHVQNPKETLSKIHKILKPGGKLIVTFPNSNGYSARKNKEKWINWHCPYHISHFSDHSLKILAQHTNFKISKIKTITSSAWMLYQAYHNFVFPSAAGTKAAFWSTGIDLNTEQMLQKENVDKLYRKKIFHIFTRILDFIGQGDNRLIVFEKI